MTTFIVLHKVKTNCLRAFIGFAAVLNFKIMIWGRKTYTLNFRTIKKRCSYGVVAKPGIATGSRSN